MRLTDMPVPWRVKNFLANLASSACYYRNVLHPPSAGDGKERLLFYVPSYGFTGGSYAVISTANLLSKNFDVAFLTHPTNIMNRYVGKKVRMVGDVSARYDFCVTELGIAAADLAKLRADGAIVILTMHGAPAHADGTPNHGYTDQAVREMMQRMDSAQFISDVQLPFFDNVDMPRRKIPNFVQQVKKHRHGRAAGIVCDTTLPHKNALLGVEMAALSRAEQVEIWGRYQGQRDSQRIHWNGFSPDKARIYNSFDVLVHLSRLENQPLVILDALSAGIPCVLADLEAYAFLRGLDGIYFVDVDDRDGVIAAINAALDCPTEVRDGLVRFWRQNHSPEIILGKWTDYLKELQTRAR